MRACVRTYPRACLLACLDLGGLTQLQLEVLLLPIWSAFASLLVHHHSPASLLEACLQVTWAVFSWSWVGIFIHDDLLLIVFCQQFLAFYHKTS